MTSTLLSPDNRFAVRLHAWEARHSLWVATPAVWELATDELLLRFADERWSAEQAAWLDAATLQLVLRKFPGDRGPASVTVTIDCQARTATVGAAEPMPLAALEETLEEMLAPS